MNKNQLQILLPLGLRACLEAGREILAVYNSSFTVSLKEDLSPLTEADNKSHQVLTAALEPTGLPLLSEEGKEIPYSARKDWKAFWLADPLDGTKEFIKRNGEFTVNLALIEGPSPILGVVYAPVTGKLYFALEGMGSFAAEGLKYQLPGGLNSEKILTQAKKLTLDPLTPKGPLRIAGSRSHMSPETQNYLSSLTADRPMEVFPSGSSLKFCMVAEGQVDLYPRFGTTMEWDTAAGQAVVEQAGGIVVEAGTGLPLRYNKEDLRNPSFIAGKKGITQA